MVRTPGIFHDFLDGKHGKHVEISHGNFMGFNDLNETSWRCPWDFLMMFDLLETLGDFTRFLRLHGDFSWELSW